LGGKILSTETTLGRWSVWLAMVSFSDWAIAARGGGLLEQGDSRHGVGRV
jgi:hypothetical protein